VLTLASIASSLTGGLVPGSEVAQGQAAGRRVPFPPDTASPEQTHGIDRQGALRAALLMREEEMQHRAQTLRAAGIAAPSGALVEKMYPPYPTDYLESRQRLMRGTQLEKQDERLMKYVNPERISDRAAGQWVENDLQALILGARVAQDLASRRPAGLAQHSALAAGIGLEGWAP